MAEPGIISVPLEMWCCVPVPVYSLKLEPRPIKLQLLIQMELELARTTTGRALKNHIKLTE